VRSNEIKHLKLRFITGRSQRQVPIFQWQGIGPARTGRGAAPGDAMRCTVLVIVILSVSLSVYHTRGLCPHGLLHYNHVFRGGPWTGGVKWECDRWKWRFSLLSFTVFRTFYIRGHTTAFTWCDCRWPWRYFKVIRLFHIKFCINGVWYGKSYCRLLIGNHTLAFDWCHFWWPCMIFEGHFTLPRLISWELYRIRQTELFIRSQTSAFRWCECRWPWRYFMVIRLFHIKVLVNGAL